MVKSNNVNKDKVDLKSVKLEGSVSSTRSKFGETLFIRLKGDTPVPEWLKTTESNIEGDDSKFVSVKPSKFIKVEFITEDGLELKTYDDIPTGIACKFEVKQYAYTFDGKSGISSNVTKIRFNLKF